MSLETFNILTGFFETLSFSCLKTVACIIYSASTFLFLCNSGGFVIVFSVFDRGVCPYRYGECCVCSISQMGSRMVSEVFHIVDDGRRPLDPPIRALHITCLNFLICLRHFFALAWNETCGCSCTSVDFLPQWTVGVAEASMNLTTENAACVCACEVRTCVE